MVTISEGFDVKCHKTYIYELFMQMKTCNRCKRSLDNTEFVKNCRSTDGINSWCKSCCKEYKQEHYKKNREKIANRAKEYREKNREELVSKKREYNRKNRERNKLRCREYYQRNKERLSEWQKKYNAEHVEEIAKRNRLYSKKNYTQRRAKQKEYERRNSDQIREYKREWTKRNRGRLTQMSRERARELMKDPLYRLKRNLRTRLHHALAGHHKTDRTMNLVGCSLTELMQHIEAKFQSGMTWENYGKWHIDHIKPCAAFDLSNIVDQRECFHYTNLQPLWAEDNLRKQATYDPSVPIST